MATKPPSSVPPLPPSDANANGSNGAAPSAAAVKQAQNNVVADIVATNEAKGLNTYNISPNATPQDTQAIAAKAKAQLGLPPVLNQSAEKGAKGLSIAQPKGAPIVPTLTVEDVDAKPAAEPIKPSPVLPLSAVSDKSTTPGDLPAGKAPVIPDWYKIGWRAVSGVDEPLPEGVERDRSILFQFVNEQYYGEWYHNAAIIIVAVVFTHLMTLLRMGWGWMLILLAFACTYYSASMERFRRRARDDIQRELTKTRLDDETETADWMNNFLNRFWLIYEPVLSTSIINSVAQVLSTSTPAFLDSIALTTFSLGTKAPHIDHVRTYPKTEDDIIMMEWGISFTPNDVSDMTYRQAAKKQNPKIILEIRVGKGFTAGIPILLEDITFQGVMKFRLKLMNAFPHVQIVDICFTQKPWFDYVLKPIGGETFGFDVASIPGLSPFIRDTVHSVLGPMMYEPNVFTLNLEQLMSGVPIDTAIGVLQITVISAAGLKASKMGGGTPDPYVAISINNNQQLERTKPKMSTRTPVWNETKFVLVSALSGTLGLSIWDFNEHRKDTELGTVNWELNKLVEDSSHEGIVSKVQLDGKEKGELKYDVSFFPVIKPVVVDGKPEPIPETSVGVVRLVIHQAKELDPSKNTVSKDLNPFIKVYTNGEFIHSTPVNKHSLNPIWESAKEFLCADKENCTISFKVIDDRDFLKDPVIGFANVKLQDLLDAKAAGKDWFPLSGCNSGRVRISTEWKPLDMAGSLHGAAKYVPPIGVVRLLMKRAVDVKNVEGGLGGKSDPYVRVMVNNTVMARTEVVNNNLSPVWDQFMYIPVHSLRETIYLEVMDYQHLTKDRPLGHVELEVSNIAVATTHEDHQYPFESLGVRGLAEKIKVDTSFKGELHFTAEFVPALHLAGVSFSGQNALEKVFEDDRAADSDSDQEIPTMLTYDGAKTKASNGTAAPANGAAAAAAAAATAAGNGHKGDAKESKPVDPTDEDDAVKLTKEQILAAPSGVIVFDIISGQLHKKSRLEILMDDGYWPVFATSKARSTAAVWDTVGEGFVKELDFGRVWLRLNEKDDGEKEEIIAEYKADAKNFLEKALDGPTEFTLTDVNGDNASIVKIAAKFVPVPIKLSPRESINNQGRLRVEIIEGKDIHGADRSGTSDPYVVLTLNGEKVYKTEVIKKTLNPKWNETAECIVPSRAGADMIVEVFDWDRLGANESIGKGPLDLEKLEPFQPVNITVPLVTTKYGQKGSVSLRVLFTPEIIAKSRKGTSTFSTAERAATQIGSAPLLVGKGVAGGVGMAGKGVVGGVSNVGKGVKGIFGGKKTGTGDSELALTGGATNASGQPVVLQEPPSTQVVEPVPISSTPPPPKVEVTGYHLDNASQTFPKTPTEGHSREGTLRVVVQNGKDMQDSDGDQVKPYVVLTVDGKELKTKHTGKTNAPEWDESFSFPVGPESKSLHLEVFDHKTIGRDKSIGQTDIPIWEKLQVGGSNALPSVQVSSELTHGVGQLTVRLEFEQGNGGLGARAASIGSMDRPGVGSPSRFSMRKAKSPFADS